MGRSSVARAGVPVVLSILLALASPAAAGTSSEVFVARPLARYVLVDVRGGVQGTTATVSPAMCVEISSATKIGAAIEACGSGAGFLFPAELDEMVHFRGEVTARLAGAGRTHLDVSAGLGIAEIEHGGDDPGFLFGKARTPDQREGAGPEAALGAKVRYWFHERAYVVGEATVGAAWVPSADVVLGVNDPVLPFAGATVGLGF